MVRKALGKGLSALIPDATGGSGVTEGAIVEIAISSIKRNRFQPRSQFDEDSLKELAESIRQNGLIQPIVVRKSDGGYEVVVGERRLRAAALVGYTAIPASVVEASDEEALRLALVENIQRDDLNPLECATAYRRLIDEFRMTQEQVASGVGKDRATVANYLRLLGLAPRAKELLRQGKLTFGHARALLAIEESDAQDIAAALIVAEGLSVREAERLAARGADRIKKAVKKKAAPTRDLHLMAVQDKLQQSLGTKVRVVALGKGGRIEIEYYSLDELDRLLSLLGVEEV